MVHQTRENLNTAVPQKPEIRATLPIHHHSYFTLIACQTAHCLSSPRNPKTLPTPRAASPTTQTRAAPPSRVPGISIVLIIEINIKSLFLLFLNRRLPHRHNCPNSPSFSRNLILCPSPPLLCRTTSILPQRTRNRIKPLGRTRENGWEGILRSGDGDIVAHA